MVAFPLVLPMGWVNSPPYFCAATETAADLMNARLRRQQEYGPHHLEEEALTGGDSKPIPSSASGSRAQQIHPPRYRRPLQYVDDFIALLQGGAQEQRNTMRVLLSTLDDIFRPVIPSDDPSRQEPASQKKLRKGDASWSTRKVVLGWVIDIVAGTLELPPHRQERLRAILADICPSQKRASVKKWHRLLGELRSMTLAIPGSRGLFSVLQEALKYDQHGKPCRVRLTRAVHQFLADFRRLADNLESRPTRIAEIFPRTPSVLGATDASGRGMGGIAFVHLKDSRVDPILWRNTFPKTIVKDFVSFENPTGTVSNSDLELAATVIQPVSPG